MNCSCEVDKTISIPLLVFLLTQNLRIYKINVMKPYSNKIVEIRYIVTKKF